MKWKHWLQWIFSKAQLALGLLLLGFGVSEAVSSPRFLRHAERVQGQVVDVVYERGRHGPKSVAVVEYTPPGGAPVRFQARSGISHHIGAPVELLHDPHHPGVHRFETFHALWAPSVLATGFGLMFIMAGMVVSWSFANKRRRAS